jgi:DNA-directed RNA polymerase alpha subunit
MHSMILYAARDAMEAANGDFSKAKQILVQQAKADQRLCNLLVGPILEQLCAEVIREVRATLNHRWPPDLDAKISTLNLSNRAANCLTNGNIGTVGELVERSQEELRRLPGFGLHVLAEIKNALAERGLSLESRSRWLESSQVP